MLGTFIQQTVNALTIGSIYALIALGYTMVYGVLRMINFAHGEMFMLGAYAAFLVLTVFVGDIGAVGAFGLTLAFFGAVIAVGFFGVGLDRNDGVERLVVADVVLRMLVHGVARGNGLDLLDRERVAAVRLDDEMLDVALDRHRMVGAVIGTGCTRQCRAGKRPQKQAQHDDEAQGHGVLQARDRLMLRGGARPRLIRRKRSRPATIPAIISA